MDNYKSNKKNEGETIHNDNVLEQDLTHISSGEMHM